MLAKWIQDGNLLKELIDGAYDTHADFARAMDVTPDVVYNLVKGITKLRGDRKKKAAYLLGVPQEHLSPPRKRPHQNLQSTETPPAPQEPPRFTNLGKMIPVQRAGIRVVPIYGSVPAGLPGQTFSDAIDFEEYPEWGGDFDRWGRIIEGDSMTQILDGGEFGDDYFLDGDIAIFENRAAISGQGVHARKDGQDVFKVLVETAPGEAELRSINPGFEPINSDGWEILGVCIKRVRFGSPPERYKDTREYELGFRWRGR